jgi:hypothetical protein
MLQTGCHRGIKSRLPVVVGGGLAGRSAAASTYPTGKLAEQRL